MARNRQTVLVISEDARVLDEIRTGLSSKGFSIRTARGSRKGLSSFLKLKPDFVILNFSPRSGLSLMTLGDICGADPHARIIVIGSCTDDSFAMECIRHGAMDYVREPLQMSDIVQSIQRINNRRRLLRMISEPDVDCVHEEDKVLIFGNDTTKLPYVINQAVHNAEVVCGDIPMLKTALCEIVLNAIEHGNLEITMEEKAQATSTGEYSELLSDRIRDSRYAARTVTVRIHMNRDELVYSVTDQGNGFDHKTRLSSDLRVHGGSGLGLFLARNFFTSITYNDCGNSVTLVYRRPREDVRRTRNNAR